MFDKGQAMLLWALECDKEMAAEWNEWYNLEHLPALVEVPGFISGNRFERNQKFELDQIAAREEVPLYLSFYELYDDQVLESEAYHINRTSQAPGMRPEWTKRMLTNLTQIMGGKYYPMSDTTINRSNRDTERLVAFYIDPKESELESFNEWYRDVFVSKVRNHDIIDAVKLIGNLDTAPPKVLGGVKQIPGPKRVIFMNVDKHASENDVITLQHLLDESASLIDQGIGIIYNRIPLTK